MFTTDQPVTGPAKSHPTCAGYARQSTVLSLILKLLSLFTICHILYYVLAVWKLVSTQMLLLQQVNCELLEHFAQSITQQFSYRWLLFFMHAWIMSSNFWDVNSLLWQSVCVCVCAHYVTCSAGMTFSWRWLFTELVKACGNTVTHLDLCPGFFCCCINIVTCHNTGIRFQFTCFCQMKYLQIFWFPGTVDTVSPLDKDNTPVSPKPLSFTAELFCVMG